MRLGGWGSTPRTIGLQLSAQAGHARPRQEIVSILREESHMRYKRLTYRWARLALVTGLVMGTGTALADLMIVGVDGEVAFDEVGAVFHAPGNDVGPRGAY